MGTLLWTLVIVLVLTSSASGFFCSFGLQKSLSGKCKITTVNPGNCSLIDGKILPSLCVCAPGFFGTKCKATIITVPDIFCGNGGNTDEVSCICYDIWINTCRMIIVGPGTTISPSTPSSTSSPTTIFTDISSTDLTTHITTTDITSELSSSVSPEPPTGSTSVSPEPPTGSTSLSPEPPTGSTSISPEPPTGSTSVSPEPPTTSTSVSPEPPTGSTSISPEPPTGSTSVSPEPPTGSTSVSPEPPTGSTSVSPEPPTGSTSVSPEPPTGSTSVSPEPPTGSTSVSPEPPTASTSVSPEPPTASTSVSPEPPTGSTSLSPEPPTGSTSISPEPPTGSTSVSPEPPTASTSVSPEPPTASTSISPEPSTSPFTLSTSNPTELTSTGSTEVTNLTSSSNISTFDSPTTDPSICSKYLYGKDCEFIYSEIRLDLVIIKLVISIHMQKEYNSSLMDPSSSYYQHIKGLFLGEMTQVYKKLLPRFKEIKIVSFRQGSVIVNHEVLLEVDYSNCRKEAAQAEDKLRDYLSNLNDTSYGREFQFKIEDINDSDLCFEEESIPQVMKPYFSGVNMSKYLLCVTECSVKHESPINCKWGQCSVSDNGPRCYCDISDEYWYTGDRCETPVSKPGVIGGVVVGLIVLVAIILLLVFCLCCRHRNASKDLPVDTNPRWDQHGWERDVRKQGRLRNPETDDIMFGPRGPFHTTLETVNPEARMSLPRPQTTS